VEAFMAELEKLFGLRVRELRSSRDLTQAQLADAAQVSEEWIRRIERGATSPSFATIEALAGALGVGPEELFAAGPPRSDGDRLSDAIGGLSASEVKWLIEGARLLKAKRSL
jgi:transcriptional regulator with XRE-family HTH domain